MTLLEDLSIGVGHWSDADAQTGCTVMLFPTGCVASAEIRGGAPASRETDVLRPDKSVQTVDAVCLTGGSAFGLGTADGVMRFLEAQGRGVPTPAGPVPIVPTLALFDLATGSAAVRPSADAGYRAAENARTTATLETGRVGAGTGAYFNQQAGPGGRQPGGVVHAEIHDGGVSVAALVVVNAFGNIAGADGGTPSTSAAFVFDDAGRAHTTLGVVVTNAHLSKADCHLVAQGAHDGLARAIDPPHTRFDGDAFIAVSAGTVEAPLDTIRFAAVRAVDTAIRSLGPAG